MVSALLAIHRGGLGDFLLALPALWSLYMALSPKRFVVAGNPWVLEVVEGVGWIDELHDVNIPPFSRLEMGEGRLDYPLAVVFSRDEGWRKALRAVGVKEVWLLPPFPSRRIHITHHHLESLKDLGITVKVFPPGLFLSEEEVSEGRAFLREKGLVGAYFTIHPGAGGRQKVWPPERMAEVALWGSMRGYQVVLVEGPADREVCDAFFRSFGRECLHLRTPPLRLLSAIIGQGVFFLGNDSGITHLAALSGCPTVALFGPTDPMIWAPLGRRSFWIQGRAGCAPCAPEMRRGCKSCKAMEAIRVEEVVEAIKGLIGEG